VRCGRCGTVFNGIAALIDEVGESLSVEPEPPGEPVPEFLAERAPRRFVAWAFAAGLALLVLAGQVAYRYRNELAAYVPAARAPLREACALLDCELSLPRRPELMTIESSDLQADPRRENVIVLNAVLRNRAAYPQQYPALELTLTDPSDRPVVRRVLAPQDYLDRTAGAASPAQGLGSGAELAVRVYFDAGRTRATGYRLYLFYP
jgi:hypothetical protein